MTSILVTARGETHAINIFDGDEGGQQERLALWLTDHLDPGRVLVNPRASTGTRPRELCDVFAQLLGWTVPN